MKLTNDQLNALDIFEDFIVNSDNQYMIIQGDSGTGKSTLIKEMLKMIEQNHKMSELLMVPATMKWEPVLTATTNKAAESLSKIIDDDVRTIHSFLNLVIQPDYSTGKEKLVQGKGWHQKENMLIIIDEASFISNTLFTHMQESTKNCKIILIGDQYQLAPVKQKSPIMSAIASNHKAELTEIVRHTGNISTLGKQFKHAVSSDIFKPITANTSDIIYADGDTFRNMINKAFDNQNYVPEDARVLAWTNNRVLEYDAHIRKIKGYSALFNVGEYVVTNKPQLIARRRILPTDSIVYITEIQEDVVKNGIPGRMVAFRGKCTGVAFLPDNQLQVRAYLKQLKNNQDWREFFTVKEQWLDLRSVYASTVHKSQGSEYKQVFIDLSDIGRCTINTDAARLLYVGITRATEQVILYGSLPARLGGEVLIT